MNKDLKKYLFSILITVISIIILTVILSLLSYFDLINDNVIKILKMVITSISPLIGGFYIGEKTERRGYQNGLKLGLIIVVIFFFLNLIFNTLTIKYLITSLIIIPSSMLGAMLGINKRSKS